MRCRLHHLWHVQPNWTETVLPSSISGLVFLQLLIHTPPSRKDNPPLTPDKATCLLGPLSLKLRLILTHLAPVKGFLLTSPAPLTQRFPVVLTQPRAVFFQNMQWDRRWRGKMEAGPGTPAGNLLHIQKSFKSTQPPSAWRLFPSLPPSKLSF